MTYSLEQLAAGSYDVFLDGALVAALAREVDRSGVTRKWLVELLDETPSADRPAPFTAQSHAFGTRAAALAWLGIGGAGEDVEEQLREHVAP